MLRLRLCLPAAGATLAAARDTDNKGPTRCPWDFHRRRPPLVTTATPKSVSNACSQPVHDQQEPRLNTTKA